MVVDVSSQHPEPGAPVAPDAERWLPPGYSAAHLGGVLAVARANLLVGLLGLLREHGTLYGWAASRGGARPLAGRGIAYAVDAPEASGERWVVRHYRRGGAVRWLGDRYLRLGRARPLAELRASAAVRARGIHTPEVLALVIYPAGAFYRADLATVEIPGAIDLAQALWAEHAAAGDTAARLSALAAAAALLRQLAEAGVAHPDLNAKNILLTDGSAMQAHVLDLDGCRVGAPLDAGARAAARARLARSLHKWERRTGRPLAAAEWAALEEGQR